MGRVSGGMRVAAASSAAGITHDAHLMNTHIVQFGEMKSPDAWLENQNVCHNFRAKRNKMINSALLSMISDQRSPAAYVRRRLVAQSIAYAVRVNILHRDDDYAHTHSMIRS